MLVARMVAEVGLEDGVDAADVMFFIGGAISVLTLLALIRGLPLWKRICDLFRTAEDLRDMWYGQPAGPGHDAVPGIPERINRIDGELQRNGGSTMKDAIFETKRLTEEVVRRADRLSARLDTSEEVRMAILDATNRNMEATREAFLAAGLEPPAFTTIPIPKMTNEEGKA